MKRVDNDKNKPCRHCRSGAAKTLSGLHVLPDQPHHREECECEGPQVEQPVVVQRKAPDPLHRTIEVPEGYESLGEVLQLALNQAAHGKGKERHADAGVPFDMQQSAWITRRQGPGYPAGQAEKKSGESARLGKEARIEELLGAIVYNALAVIAVKRDW